MSVILWQIAAEPDAKIPDHEDTNSYTSMRDVSFSGSFPISADTKMSSSFLPEATVVVLAFHMRFGLLLRFLMPRLGAAFLNNHFFADLSRLVLVFSLRVTVRRNVTSGASAVSADDVLRIKFVRNMVNVVCLCRVSAGFKGSLAVAEHSGGLLHPGEDGSEQ